MPFNGSGTFNRTFPPGGWQGDASAQIKITAVRHDQHDKDLADGLTNVICKDGQSTVTSDIPFNGHKIIGLANGVNPTDAATIAQLQGLRTFSTGIILSGSATNGFVSYTGTGAVGSSYVVSDLFTGTDGAGWWIWNSKADGSATKNTMTLSKTGTLNLYVKDDGAGAGPTVALIRDSASPAAGDLLGYINFVGKNSLNADITYADIFSRVTDPADATKKGALVFRIQDTGTMDEELVVNYLGITSKDAVTANQTFQSSTAAAVFATTGAGNVYLRPNGAASATGQTVVDSSGNMSITGGYTGNGYFSSASANAILSAVGGGGVYLRPNGSTNGSGQVSVDGTGNIQPSNNTTYNVGLLTNVYSCANNRCKNGISISGGAFGANWYNMLWNGSAMVLFADNSNLGTINTTSDYRIKKDVTDLPSTWDRIKALRPIRYTQAEFDIIPSEETEAATGNDPETRPAPTPLFPADDIERWGFIAHEAQATLLPTAASGEKDMKDGVQGLNWAPIVAALTKALQEAMARIEALEARAT